MKTYFLSFNVSPDIGNIYCEKIAGADIFFWVVDNSPDMAQKRAEAYLFRECWKILEQEQSSVEITAEQCAQRNTLSLENYLAAQERGMAVAITAWLEGADKKKFDLKLH